MVTHLEKNKKMKMKFIVANLLIFVMIITLSFNVVLAIDTSVVEINTINVVKPIVYYYLYDFSYINIIKSLMALQFEEEKSEMPYENLLLRFYELNKTCSDSDLELSCLLEEFDNDQIINQEYDVLLKMDELNNIISFKDEDENEYRYKLGSKIKELEDINYVGCKNNELIFNNDYVDFNKQCFYPNQTHYYYRENENNLNMGFVHEIDDESKNLIELSDIYVIENSAILLFKFNISKLDITNITIETTNNIVKDYYETKISKVLPIEYNNEVLSNYLYKKRVDEIYHDSRVLEIYQSMDLVDTKNISFEVFYDENSNIIKLVSNYEDFNPDELFYHINEKELFIPIVIDDKIDYFIKFDFIFNHYNDIPVTFNNIVIENEIKNKINPIYEFKSTVDIEMTSQESGEDVVVFCDPNRVDLSYNVEVLDSNELYSELILPVMTKEVVLLGYFDDNVEGLMVNRFYDSISIKQIEDEIDVFSEEIANLVNDLCDEERNGSLRFVLLDNDIMKNLLYLESQESYELYNNMNYISNEVNINQDFCLAR